MAFNGSGVFLRVRNWVADAAALIKIRADLHDSEDDNFASGLSNCICRDGQSTILVDIPWSGKKITNLGTPTANGDAVTKAYADLRLTNVVRTLFTSTGTWTKRADAKVVEFEGCGGGGSGAAAVGTAATTWALGAGGGAGAWGRKIITDAESLAASMTITVGAGGGASSGVGQAGSASSVPGLMTLPGGTGGTQASNTTSTANAITANSGAPSGVDVGGPGAGSDYSVVNIGGLSFMGRAGANMYGTPPPWLVVTAQSAIGSVAGIGYGSGSGGSINPNSATLKASVAASPGFILITEWY